MTYTNEQAADLLRWTTGITELPENCDGLAACLNAALKAQQGKPVQTSIWVAKLHWGNHPFEGFGSTSDESMAALRLAWNNYAAGSKSFNTTGLSSKNGGAPMFDEQSIEGITLSTFAKVREVRIGQAYLHDIPYLTMDLPSSHCLFDDSTTPALVWKRHK